MVISFAVAFGLTLMLGMREKAKQGVRATA
jgi:PTS system sucrose-specific IIC component